MGGHQAVLTTMEEYTGHGGRQERGAREHYASAVHLPSLPHRGSAGPSKEAVPTSPAVTEQCIGWG